MQIDRKDLPLSMMRYAYWTVKLVAELAGLFQTCQELGLFQLFQ